VPLSVAGTRGKPNIDEHFTQTLSSFFSTSVSFFLTLTGLSSSRSALYSLGHWVLPLWSLLVSCIRSPRDQPQLIQRGATNKEPTLHPSIPMSDSNRDRQLALPTILTPRPSGQANAAHKLFLSCAPSPPNSCIMLKMLPNEYQLVICLSNYSQDFMYVCFLAN
jgi:hypothetical protein